MEKNEIIYCNFCEKSNKKVSKMIVSSNKNAICDECVLLSVETLILNSEDTEEMKQKIISKIEKIKEPRVEFNPKIKF